MSIPLEDKGDKEGDNMKSLSKIAGLVACKSTDQASQEMADKEIRGDKSMVLGNKLCLGAGRTISKVIMMILIGNPLVCAALLMSTGLLSIYF